MANEAGAYPGFHSMKWLGVFLLPSGWDASPGRATSGSKLPGIHLYTWVERGTMRVKYLAQEHNAVPRPGLEPGPFDLESSALTVRPPRLPWTKTRYLLITSLVLLLWRKKNISSLARGIGNKAVPKSCSKFLKNVARKLLQKSKSCSIKS